MALENGFSQSDFALPGSEIIKESDKFLNKMNYKIQSEEAVDPNTGLPYKPGAINGADYPDEKFVGDIEESDIKGIPDMKPRGNTFKEIIPVAFDIETYRRVDMQSEFEGKFLEEKRDKRLKDPDKVAENFEKIRTEFALSPRTGRIIMVGFYRGLDDYTVFGANKESEKKILELTWQYIAKILNSGQKLVSFGGKRFDLPFLFARAIVNRIDVTLPVSMNELVNKYSTLRHLDLENVFSEGSLASWAYLLGESTSFENDGVNIDAWYTAKQIDKIRDKNKADLEYTLSLYNIVKGWW